MIDLFAITRAARERLAEEGLGGAYTKRLDALTGKEGTVVRLVSSMVVDSHYDLGTCLDVTYQVVCRRLSEAEAMADCTAAATALQHHAHPIAGGQVVDQEIYTPPQELELNESGYYAYETRLIAHVAQR